MIPSLALLREIVVEASRAGSLEQQLECVVRHVHYAMRVAVCSVYLRQEDGRLLLISTLGLSSKSVGNLALQPGEGLVGTIAATQLPLLLERASEHPAYLHFPESGEEAFEAFLGVPVVHLGETVGVLVVQEREERRFTDEEEAFLVTVAAQLAGVLQRWNRIAESESRPETQALQVAGSRGSPGIAVGVLHILADELDSGPEEAPGRSDALSELSRLRKAVQATLDSFEEAADRMREELSHDVVSVFDFYKLLLTQDTLVKTAEEAVLRG
ncbi:MAG: GAF domain-containing protein, partial [Thermoanaerobaculia bacterium]|nr:GAF domain-containing protein [Thermoanaerobaculia bacterium]